MSSIYHTEPPTQGKVVIKTSFGDVDIELWSREAPLACRNFIQLALEGYYDHSEVGRAIKGFMVQMGDPTGTGLGGSSIWGKPFKDEIHGRIKFNHRGQLAMANGNKPNSNQSQFFITLDACDWLNGKHTIFGKVTGSTIFNVIRMGEVEVGENDKPTDPIRILSVEVLFNPFDDIVPRVTKKIVGSSDKGSFKDDHVKAVKDKNLLSFGEDEENGEDVPIVKFRSVHDMKKKSKRSDTTSQVHIGVTSEEKNEEVEYKEKILEKRVEHLQKQTKSLESGIIKELSDIGEGEEEQQGLIDRETWDKLDRDHLRNSALQKKNEEFLKTRAELLKSRRAVHVLTGAEALQYQQETAYRELATPLQQRRMKYMKRKNEFGDRSEETLAKLKKFTESLRHKRTDKQLLPESKLVQTETYHGQILEIDSDNDERDIDDWFVGKLKCRKHIDQQYRFNDSKDNSIMKDDYIVIDPRRN